MDRVFKYILLSALFLPFLFVFFKISRNILASPADVCPAGNVKAEWDETNDLWVLAYGSYSITGNNYTVNWTPFSGQVCLKQGNEPLVYLAGSLGTATTTDPAWSHIVLYFGSPTPTATPTSIPTMTPTNDPTVTPTVSPTFTPTVTPTVTPTSTPEEPTPTPTVPPEFTPTPTSTATSGPTSTPNPPNPPQCIDPKPNTPYLQSVEIQGDNSVLLTWQPVLGSVTDYSILYGPSSGNYPYSVVSTGNVNSYVINGLTQGCFAVRAINGCMPGDLSNELCISGGTGGQVLGASTLGATGVFEDNFYYFIFILGSLLTGFGIRKTAAKRVR